MKSAEMREKLRELGDLELKVLAYTTYGIGPERPRTRLFRRMALEERLRRLRSPTRRRVT